MRPGATEQAGGEVGTRQAESLRAGPSVAGRALVGYALRVAEAGRTRGRRCSHVTPIPCNNHTCRGVNSNPHSSSRRDRQGREHVFCFSGLIQEVKGDTEKAKPAFAAGRPFRKRRLLPGPCHSEPRASQPPGTPGALTKDFNGKSRARKRTSLF